MLNDALFQTMRDQYERVVDTFAVPMVWTKAKTSATQNVQAAMRIATDQDLALVQSYGVGARILTIKATGLTGVPEKFDRFSCNGETYAAEAVVPVHLNSAVVGFRIYVKGR